MEMRLRAEQDIKAGEDITPQIPPIAFSLSDPFLLSHCSACFLPLKNPQTNHNNQTNSTHVPQPSLFLSCDSHPNSSLLYCSRSCIDADSDRHRSSAECHLLQSQPSTWRSDDTSNLRVALRLILSFERLGLLIHPRVSKRIGGLVSNREKFNEDDEILERIREGGRIMNVAGKMRDGAASDSIVGREEGENELEEAVFCLVLTNAVEVQVSDGRAVGTAVYGPGFSWFNHSCTPNACYRFALARSDNSGFGESGFRVFASGEEDEDTVSNARSI